MPVTKTAKRALRSSKRKESVNKIIANKLEIAIRKAKKAKSAAAVAKAVSVVDRAAKKNIIHRSRAARTKRQLAALVPHPKKKTEKKAKK